jgi:hypothetical protein
VASRSHKKTHAHRPHITRHKPHTSPSAHPRFDCRSVVTHINRPLLGTYYMYYAGVVLRHRALRSKHADGRMNVLRHVRMCVRAELESRLGPAIVQTAIERLGIGQVPHMSMGVRAEKEEALLDMHRHSIWTGMTVCACPCMHLQSLRGSLRSLGWSWLWADFVTLSIAVASMPWAVDSQRDHWRSRNS